MREQQIVCNQRTKIYGYAFVNEYWKTQCIDKEVVYADIQKVINQKVESKKALEQQMNIDY